MVETTDRELAMERVVTAAYAKRRFSVVARATKRGVGFAVLSRGKIVAPILPITDKTPMIPTRPYRSRGLHRL